MKTRSSSFSLVGCLVLSALAGLASTAAPLQTISTPDASSAPTLTGAGDSSTPFLSADGRYVLFASTAANLAAVGTNSLPLPTSLARLNVYLRDRTNGTTALVSVNLAGTGGGDGDSVPCGLSPDGRYALFESSAGNLVAGDTNAASDVFLRDMLTAVTTLASVATNGSCANGPSGTPTMTPDGQFIVFSSSASNLVPNDTNGIPDIFVYDVYGRLTTLVTPGATAVGLSSSSDTPRISADGRYVVFHSTATNLVADATSNNEIYMRDLALGITSLASVGAHDLIPSNSVAFSHLIGDGGQYVVYQANGMRLNTNVFIFRYHLSSGLTDVVASNAVPSIATFCRLQTLDMSPDGRFIAFVARPDDNWQTTNQCVYLWDGQSGATTLVSPDANNLQTVTANCEWPVVDPSGRFVAFFSTATNLTTNIVAGEFHLYVRDVQSGTTKLVDLETNGFASAKSFLSAPGFASDARFLAFDCTDSALVPNDNNQAYDVFVYDLTLGAVEIESTRQLAFPSQTAQGASSRPGVAVSTDGRYVAFASSAANVTAGSASVSQGLYWRDQLLGTNLLLNLDTNGLPTGGGWSIDPSISADGRFVAFTSSATNLVRGDNNGMSDVFVYDVQLGTNYLVSVNTSGAGPGNQPSYSPTISSGGQRVLFRSRSSNLASGTTSGENCFWRDLQSNRTYAVTTSGSSCCALTPDGRFVAYAVPPNGLFLWDAQTASTVYTKVTTSLVTNIAVSPDGNRLAGLSGSRLFLADRAAGTNWTIAGSSPITWLSHATLQFSASGQFLVYVTAASLVAGDTNGTTDVYLYDFASRSNVLVSQSCNWPGAANSASDSATITADGRFIAYRSFASDVVPGDTNGVPDVFLYDRLTDSTSLLSVSAWGDFAANNRSGYPVFSGDGQTVCFQSWASDLVVKDLNQSGDVFAFTLPTSGSIPAFSAEIMFLPETGVLPTLVWPAQPGASYRVQYKDDLDDAAWQDLLGSISFVGGSGYATDLLPSSGKRFYRLVGF